MIVVQEVLDAVGFGPKAAPPEGVDVDFLGRGLESADEVAGEADAGDWQFQAAREEKVNCAEANRVASPAVHDPIQIAILGVVAELLMARKGKLMEEIIIDEAKGLLGRRGKINPFPQFTRPTVVK